MRTSVSSRRRIAGGVALAGGVLLALSGLAVPANAASVEPSQVQGNPRCADLGYEFGVKIDTENPGDGDYTGNDLDGEGGVDTSAITITLSNTGVVDGKYSIDFDSNQAFDAVFMKQANGGNLFEYPAPVTSDTNVYSTGADVSHVSFCWNTPDETDDGGDDDGGDDDGGDGGTDDGGTDDGGTDDGGTDEVAGEVVVRTPTEVLPNVVEQPAPAAPAPAAAPAQQLPRTGTETDLALIGLGLLLAGAGFVLYSNPLPAFAGRRK